MRQNGGLKAKNMELGAKLLLVGDGKRDTVHAKKTSVTHC